MKLIFKPAAPRSANAPLAKAEIPGLVEQLLKSFADRLPPPPKQLQ